MNTRTKRIIRWGLVIGLLLLIAAELAARMAGLVDFPLYEGNSQIGYAVRPNQQGAFMNRNDWIFNEYGMGAGHFQPGPDKTDILLVGDSIVYGGNPYQQRQRLAPQMEALSSNIRVWPISAGSWALQNELTWLEQHPEVLRQVDRVDFVLNSGDFDEPSSWKCETTHPRHAPVSAVLYLFQKNVWDWSRCSAGASPFPVPSRDWRPRLKAFLSSPSMAGKPVVFHLYPDQKEYEQPALYREWVAKEEAELKAAGATAVRPLFTHGSLPAGYYKDGIHPSVSGVPYLAKAILADSSLGN